MDIKQAFAELGLTQEANHAEARTAYRTLAMCWHPDVNTGIETETRMKAINVAYALVCQYLDTHAQKAAALPRPASGFCEFDWKTGFASGPRAPSHQPEDRVQRTIRVSMFEAAFGCSKRIHGRVFERCSRCPGSGDAPGSWSAGANCLKCLGLGRLQASGQVEGQTWMAEVPIHAGTLDGTVVQASDIRLRAGLQAAPRSFNLTVQIEKHPLFRLDQNRLSVTVPISVWRWAMGGEITVPTLDGTARVALPSKPAVLLVKNQGWPEPGAPRRRKPLFVMPKIIYPEQLREEDRRMLQILDVRSHLPEVQGWSRHVQAWMET